MEWLKSILAKYFSGGGTTKVNYVVNNLGNGKYDIVVSLPAFGKQHYTVVFDEVSDTFTLSGKIAVVGEDSGFPVSAFSEMINSAFQSWVANVFIRTKLSEHRYKMMTKKRD